jgi:hypothetical protein
MNVSNITMSQFFREPPTRAEDVTIGLIYALMTTVSIVLYVPCLVVMHRDPIFSVHSCFRVCLFVVCFNTHTHTHTYIHTHTISLLDYVSHGHS